MKRREDVLRRRLSNQGLTRPRFPRARDVVASLGAVQAQDWPSARWSLALRMTRPTDGDIVRDFDAGEILRTHVLRPTWHFATPDDLRWMLALTAPRVRTTTRDVVRMLSMGKALTAVIVLDGRVAGSWRRTLSRRRLTVTRGAFRRLTGAQRAALAKQVERMRAFFGVDEAVVE